jgi:lysophospholipase L1-like esterase
VTQSKRGGLAARASRPTALLLAPVLLRQGARVRERTPVLPEAAGDRSGRAGAAEGVPLRLLVVGESTAAGVGVAHQRDGIAARLAAGIARRHGRPVTWAVSARTGATARATERELVRTVAGDQDLVVVILGVNDTVRLHSRRHWRGQLTRILDVLQSRLATGGHVVLAGVPDLGAFPALPQPLRAVLGWHARALDDELQSLASRRSGVVHVPSPELTDEAFAEDGFHPDADAYARWAHHLADSVAPGSTAPFRL